MDKVTLLYGNLEIGDAVVGEQNVVHLTDSPSPHKHHLKKSATHLIPSLKERLQKAIIVLKDGNDIKNAHEILKKAIADQAEIIFILPVAHTQLISKIPKDFLLPDNSKLVVLGEIVSNVSESDISKIFQKAIGTRTIEVEFGKEQSIAVISQDDATKELRRHVFSQTEKLSLLFYETPQTLQTAIHKIAKIYPDLEIIYGENPKIMNINHKQIKKNLTLQFGKKPIYANTEGFTSCIKNLTGSTEKIKKLEKRGRKKVPKIGKQLKFISLALALFLITTTGITVAGVAQLYNAKKAFANANLEKGQQALIGARKLFSVTSPTSAFIASLLPLDYKTKELIASSENTLILAVKTIQELENALKYQNIHNSQQAISQLTYAYFKFSQFPTLTQEGVLGEKTSKIASILQGLSDIPGMNGEGKYLLLFQNNAELRPTGGFIGSVGELSVEDGKIVDFTIRDVYQLDGQLKSHFEPHFIIRRHLQPHLYLRDSNFNIEFDNAAGTAAQIYASETEKKVDGVIALDFEVARTLIKHAGDIELPEHEITLTEDKAREVIHSSIHENVFAGSSKKRDILQSLLTKLLLKLETDPKLSSAFIKELPDLLEQKHILFSFQDENIQKLFSANGYTGSINDHRGEKENTINDIFGWNEANIGVNKANEYIQRKVEYEAYIGEKNIVSKATLHIFNTADRAENYKAYLRLITPNGSTIESISINGEEQKIIPAVSDPTKFEAQGFTPPIGLEVDQKEEDEYKTFGFIIEVAQGTSQKVTVLYLQKKNHTPASYSLLYVKQPGTTEYPLQASVSFNKSLQAASEEYKIQSGKAEFSSVITSDQILELELLK